MSNGLLSFKIRTVGIVFGVAIMGAWTGCVGYVDRGEPVVMYPIEPVAQTTFVIEDDYVYYPSYQIYYSSRRHQYAYRDGHNWISRPAPRGVTINQLQASPSVQMEFHDSPVQHHEAVAKQYPKNWSPSRANPERKENRKDEQRDKRNDNQH
jgi:hypothetical protein